MKPGTNHSKKGSALLLALCAIAVMSLTVLGLMELTDLGMKELADQGKSFRALQLAESGIALGLHPELEQDDPVLQQTLNSTESFKTDFASEGKKLNINTVLLRNQKEVLENLFGQWGLKSQDQSLIIDCLMDWVDTDPLKRLNGAEQQDYESRGLTGYPLNRPFEDLEEMELVPGMDALTRVKPDWKQSFTVWTDGRLDLNEASPDLIAAVCGVGSLAAESLVKRRTGPDGKAHTTDDFVYTTTAEVRSILGLSETQFAAMENRITLRSDFRFIESTGRVGSYERKLAAVVQLNVTPVQYLSWTEF